MGLGGFFKKVGGLFDKATDVGEKFDIPVLGHINKIEEAVEDLVRNDDDSTLDERATKAKAIIADAKSVAAEAKELPKLPRDSKKLAGATRGLLAIVAAWIANYFGVADEVVLDGITAIVTIFAAHQGLQGVQDLFRK